MLAEKLEEIKKTFNIFMANPDFTSKKQLRMKKRQEWFIIEQNPDKNSPYARLKNSGLFVAHIIDDENDIFTGFSIKNNIYIKPEFLGQHLDGELLRSELTPYMRDMSEKEFAGVKIDYWPDDEGRAEVVKLNSSNLHIGFRIDLIEKKFT